jgi:hypothetical protein
MKKQLLLIKLYAFLLRLYPRSHRENFADEMLLDLSDLMADAGRKGKLFLIKFCLRELVDFPMNLLKAHLESKSMNPAFQPQAARNILRIAFGFGIALALNTFGGIVAFVDQLHLDTIYHFTVQGTDIELALLNFSNLIVGPVLAALALLIVFPELRPVRHYLPVTALVFALPIAFNDLRLLRLQLWESSSFIPLDSLLAVGYVLLIGFGFGILASILSGERRKIPWLLLAGSFGYFLISWASAFLMVSLRTDPRPFVDFWQGVLSVGLRNILIGMALGLLLGLILEFKRQDRSSNHFPPVQMDSL